MPELPEVQTVVDTLRYQLGNPTIKSVQVFWSNIVANIPVEQFCKKLENQTFMQFSRRGKYLVFTLTDYVLIVHLRMEGKFYYYKENTEPLKHTHIVMQLDNGQLHYNDVRKFGKFYLYKKDEKYEVLEKLGFEPWDENLTADKLKVLNRTNKTAIKTQLLDQTMITGIGNIYANEICFDVKVNPYTPSCFISEEKWQQIILSTQRILSEAIKAGGTTIRSYTSSLGVTGLFQQSLFVHGKDGQQCQLCSNTIKKIAINGRGTYYCPTCQKLKPVVLAITGTIGSGKSYVTKYLANKGYLTISCDEINSNNLAKEETQIQLAKILNIKKEELTKQLIADKIFSDSSLKQEVEHYLHQLILDEIKTWTEMHNDQPVLFVEVPLLFETGWNKYFDYCLDVYTEKDILVKRLVENRKMNIEDVERRYNSQMSSKEKKNRSDYVIDNNKNVFTLDSNIEKFVKHIVKLLFVKE